MNDDFSLAGRTCLITGSSRGLGNAIARGYARYGAHVVVNGRNQESLEKVVNEITHNGLSCEAAVFDVTDQNAAEAAVGRIVDRCGGIDVLVNNVGYRDRRSISDFEPGAITTMLQANLAAPFELARLAAPSMISRGWGRIINITSVVAQIAGKGDATYVAAKGGLEALTRAMAADYGENGITVNAISPGFFSTEPNRERVEDPAVARWLEHRTALGRWAEPEELVGLAVLLASDASSYITGQVICVDGGMVGHI